MHCTNCGESISKEAKHCPHCGYKVSRVDNKKEDSVLQENIVKANDDGQSLNKLPLTFAKSNTWKILLLVLGIIGIYLLFSSSDRQDTVTIPIANLKDMTCKEFLAKDSSERNKIATKLVMDKYTDLKYAPSEERALLILEKNCRGYYDGYKIGNINL
jgi:hypothetical protein